LFLNDIDMTFQYRTENDERPCCIDLTVLIPTKDRPDQLACALRFYADHQAKYRFIILDASAPTVKKMNRCLIESLDISVEHHVFDEDVGVNERISRALRSCETELVLMAGDDDFIFPKAIDKAIFFLQRHPEYAACHGRAYSIAVNSMTGDREMIDLTVSKYFQRGFESGDSLERFYSYVRNWSTMAYSVQRRTLMTEAFENFTMLDNDTRFMEFYWYAYLLLMGKVKCIDELYMVRQLNLRKHWTVDEVDAWAELKAPRLLPVVVKLLSKPFDGAMHLERYCAMWVLSRQRFRPRMLLRYPWWYFSFKLLMKLGRYARVDGKDRILISDISSRLRQPGVGLRDARA
jgi:glycosyltransferase domain-containing protein